MLRPDKSPQHDGHILARLREDKGWTAYRLAKEADLPAPTVRQAERNGSITLRVARQICAALGVSLAVFDRL